MMHCSGNFACASEECRRRSKSSASRSYQMAECAPCGSDEVPWKVEQEDVEMEERGYRVSSAETAC